jgi:DNA-binding MarR family transcriptional regulator
MAADRIYPFEKRRTDHMSTSTGTSQAESKMTLSQRTVWDQLRKLAVKGVYIGSHSQLARAAHVSEATVVRALQRFEDLEITISQRDDIGRRRATRILAGEEGAP